MPTTKDILDKIRGTEEPLKIEAPKETSPTTGSILESIREASDKPTIGEQPPIKSEEDILAIQKDEKFSIKLQKGLRKITMPEPTETLFHLPEAIGDTIKKAFHFDEATFDAIVARDSVWEKTPTLEKVKLVVGMLF